MDQNLFMIGKNNIDLTLQELIGSDQRRKK